jgi:rare lipoprotein A (peptidoglycan hydrolase)
VVTVLSFTFFVQAKEFSTALLSNTEEMNTNSDAVLENTVTVLPTGMPTPSFVTERVEPMSSKDQRSLKGIASWYGPKFHGRLTANGERYNQFAYTAAHKKLPFGTIVRVTNSSNGKQTLVRINDRGPYVHNRIIDLSRRASADINVELAHVQVDLCVPTPKKLQEFRESTPDGTQRFVAVNAQYETVMIEGDVLLLFATNDFTEAMEEWKATQQDDMQTYLCFEPNTGSPTKKRESGVKTHEYIFYVATFAPSQTQQAIAMR